MDERVIELNVKVRLNNGEERLIRLFEFEACRGAIFQFDSGESQYDPCELQIKVRYDNCKLEIIDL